VSVTHRGGGSGESSMYAPQRSLSDRSSWPGKSKAV